MPTFLCITYNESVQENIGKLDMKKIGNFEINLISKYILKNNSLFVIVIPNRNFS